MNAPRPSAFTAGDWFSLATLIAGNLYPVAGVYLFGWDAFSILFFYWAENLVIGLFVILRMATRVVLGGDRAEGLLIPFFFVHYGIFCLVHGYLLLAFFGVLDGRIARFLRLENGFLDPFFGAAEAIPSFGMSMMVLAAVHCVSFIVYFLLPREYLYKDMKTLMFEPYRRIVVLHLTLILGAALVLWFRQPVIGVVLLVAIKTAGELLLFLRGWRQDEEQAAP